MKENQASPNKYEKYKQALQNEDPVLTMARLIYAETLAANCDPNDTLKAQKLIASTIHNRVIKTNTDFASGVNMTIFKRDQFASSLNFYNESKYASFLCPVSTDNIWRTSLQYAMKSKEMFQNKQPLFQESDGNDNHYYLYQHSRARTNQPPKPTWTKNPQSKMSKENTNKCVESYSL